jgi:hypothetical protein
MDEPKHVRASDGVVTGIAISAIVLTLVLAIAGSYALTLSAIHRSQGQWCDTLTLLTSAGPPHPGIPNYGRALEFYNHMVTLGRDFGCGS